MGMISDQLVDLSCNSEILARVAFNSSPGIFRTLNEDDLKNKYFLYQGSGGEITTSLTFSPSGGSIEIHTSKKENLKVSIDNICSSFGLNIDEVSKILHVSRKTVYNWIKGESSPRKSTARRIYDLLLISNSWVNSGFSGDRDQLHKPVVDGKSVFDLLSENEVNKELILFSGSRLHTILAEREPIPDPFS